MTQPTREEMEKYEAMQLGFALASKRAAIAELELGVYLDSLRQAHGAPSHVYHEGSPLPVGMVQTPDGAKWGAVSAARAFVPAQPPAAVESTATVTDTKEAQG